MAFQEVRAHIAQKGGETRKALNVEISCRCIGQGYRIGEENCVEIRSHREQRWAQMRIERKVVADQPQFALQKGVSGGILGIEHAARKLVQLA